MSLMGAVNVRIRSGIAEKDCVVNSSITDLILFDQFSSVLREELKLLKPKSVKGEKMG